MYVLFEPGRGASIARPSALLVDLAAELMDIFGLALYQSLESRLSSIHQL